MVNNHTLLYNKLAVVGDERTEKEPSGLRHLGGDALYLITMPQSWHINL